MACITLNAFSRTSDANYSSLNHGNRKSPLCHIIAVASVVGDGSGNVNGDADDAAHIATDENEQYNSLYLTFLMNAISIFPFLTSSFVNPFQKVLFFSDGCLLSPPFKHYLEWIIKSSQANCNQHWNIVSPT